MWSTDPDIRMFNGPDRPLNRTEGLLDLVKDFPRDCIMAEIGCFAGVSTRVFAENCNIVYAVDPWEPYPEISDHEVIEEAEKRFTEMRSMHSNVITLKATSAKAADTIIDGSLDVVYIDGDHAYSKVMEDLLLWTPKLKKHGLLCGHDFYQNGVHMAIMSIYDEPYKLYADTSWSVKI